MKSSLKLLSILLITLILVVSVNSICFAAVTPGEIEDKVVYNADDVSGVKGIAQKVLGLIRNVAVIAGVILISILGLKFMIGSAEERAEYKKSFMPLIIGTVVVMAAAQIASMIFSIF